MAPSEEQTMNDMAEGGKPVKPAPANICEFGIAPKTALERIRKRTRTTSGSLLKLIVPQIAVLLRPHQDPQALFGDLGQRHPRSQEFSLVLDRPQHAALDAGVGPELGEDMGGWDDLLKLQIP